MEFIVGIIAIIIFYILWSIVLYGINNSILLLFVPVQKQVNKLKRKEIYYAIAKICIILIGLEFGIIYSLNYIVFAIILSFVLALNDLIFGKDFMSGDSNVC